MVYDVAVIGTGPAGFSAALNLKILGKNFIWIGSRDLSEKAGKAERIDNYPGLPHITGRELNAAFSAQAGEMGLAITEQMVKSIVPMGEKYALMAGSEFYEARTVILATGTVRTAVLPGESALVGKGVSYCATCDGGLYRGKTIAVICNAARFEHEAAFLAGLAAKVYYFPVYKDPALSGENVEVVKERASAILGEERVSGVKLRGGGTLAVDGVFCLRDSLALSALLPSIGTEDGHIAVDRGMATNLLGVYAAGDCTGRPYQYAKAVGEGNTAAHSVVAYLAKGQAEPLP